MSKVYNKIWLTN